MDKNILGDFEICISVRLYPVERPVQLEMATFLF